VIKMAEANMGETIVAIGPDIGDACMAIART
jgi:hypothetical protein